MSKIRAVAFMSTLSTLTLFAAAPASAEADWRLAARDIGPSHYGQGGSTRTRAEVLQELASAKADPDYEALQRDARPPFVDTPSTRTRAEVIEALKNMTPAERERLRVLYSGG